MTLSTSPNLSGPQFPHIKTGIIRAPVSYSCYEELISKYMYNIQNGVYNIVTKVNASSRFYLYMKLKRKKKT